MLKKLGLLLLAGALTGCQMEQEAVDNAPRPSLNPPVRSQPAPTSGANAAPASLTRGGNTATPQRSGRAAPPKLASGVPRTWIPQVQSRAWKYIVIHHSDTRVGAAASFDRSHRARGWECLGYDFVIGNGTQSRDGEIEVGPRWARQMDGAHAGVKEFNEWGIGICLVGDFQSTRPSAAQMQSLARLTGYLMRTYRIPADRVLGHRDAKQGRTLCPGKYIDMNAVRRMAAQYAGIEDSAMPGHATLAFEGELLRNIPEETPDTELLKDVAETTTAD